MPDNKKDKQDREIRIDPDVPWSEEHNLEAARRLRVSYDAKSRAYRDSDGYVVLDRFGQPL